MLEENNLVIIAFFYCIWCEETMYKICKQICKIGNLLNRWLRGFENFIWFL